MAKVAWAAVRLFVGDLLGERCVLESGVLPICDAFGVADPVFVVRPFGFPLFEMVLFRLEAGLVG